MTGLSCNFPAPGSPFKKGCRGESKSGQLWRAKAEFRRIIRLMKHQIANRLGVAHVRDTVMQLVAGSITREQAIGAEIEVL